MPTSKKVTVTSPLETTTFCPTGVFGVPRLIVHSNEAGHGSALSLRSTARAMRMCSPSTSSSYSAMPISPHSEKSSKSSEHSTSADGSLELTPKYAIELADGSVGPQSMNVSGASVSTTTHS